MRTAVKYQSTLATITPYKTHTPQLHDSVFLADGARVIGAVTLEQNCSIWFNAVVRGDVNTVAIGQNTNIQDNCVVHCTYERSCTKIGVGVSIGHSAVIHGCIIDDNCLIGMGAIILDDVYVGRDCIVAAGAVIPPRTKIPPGSMVMGAPAKIVRSLSNQEIETNKDIAMRYLEYCKGYNFSNTK